MQAMDFGSGKKKRGIEHDREIKEVHAFPQEIVEYEPPTQQQQPQIIYVENPPQQKKGGCLKVFLIVFVLLAIAAYGSRTSRSSSSSSSRSNTTSSESRSSDSRKTGDNNSWVSNEKTSTKNGDSESDEYAIPLTKDDASDGNEDATAVGSSAEYGRYAVSIDSVHLDKTSSGTPLVIVDYTFTNRDDPDGTSFMYSVTDEVYQNGIQCDKMYFHDIENNNSHKDIQIGVSIPVSVAYELNDETSDVDVRLYPLISLEKDSLIAQKTFSIAE